MLDDVEVSSLLIAGACHDYDHPGLNNAYLINKKHEIAIRYNDVSILENHHAASSFSFFSNEKYNILKNFSSGDFKKFRKLMIECILETDMSRHFSE